VKNRLTRYAVAASVAALVALPLTQPASAFVCAPSVRPVCDTVCSHASKVCSLFG
jgi:hypothetical protein